MQELQLKLTEEDFALHKLHGAEGLAGIYGAGCIQRPEVMLLFMNPTARNVSAVESWRGIRAPWLGVRQTWKLLEKLGLVDATEVEKIWDLIPERWTEEVARNLYKHVAQRNLFITNLASCTQPDARHLSDSVFRAYLPQSHKEIAAVQPKKIVALGNQVSSVLLQRPISVSNYKTTEHELLNIQGQEFKVFPTYYPVGQGQRNMAKAIARIQAVINL